MSRIGKKRIPKVYEDISQIIERYENGESLKEIAKEYLCNMSTVYAALKNMGYKPKFKVAGRGLTAEKYILENYDSNTNKAIADILNINPSFVTSTLKKHNLSKKGKGRLVKFDLENFNTPLGQYVIGYILGDGCVWYDTVKKAYRLTISTSDKESVDNMVKFFGDIAKIYYVENSKIKTNYRINICGKVIVEYLISLGLTPKKAFNCKLNIPYNSDILRGYFDADGHVGTSYSAKITSGSKESLEDVKDFLGFGRIGFKDKEEKIYNIYFTSATKLKKLYNNMYYENCVCLTRKKIRFDNLFLKHNKFLESGNIKNNRFLQ